MTRKEAHAEAAKLLRQAAEIIDQAHALVKGARTANGIGPRIYSYSGPYVSVRTFSRLAEDIAHDAENVQCDDCGLLIAACDCKWSNDQI